MVVDLLGFIRTPLKELMNCKVAGNMPALNQMQDVLKGKKALIENYIAQLMAEGTVLSSKNGATVIQHPSGLRITLSKDGDAVCSRRSIEVIHKDSIYPKNPLIKEISTLERGKLKKTELKTLNMDDKYETYTNAGEGVYHCEIGDETLF